MARIGLIDVDGHNFPNLALMRISSYHKAMGDIVEWWDGFQHYDRVYKSKIFSESYTEDEPDPVNADEIIKGGTGYCISLVNGREVYDRSKDHTLPAEVEHSFPDYSIYPKYGFAVSMTSRGCPRGCSFCHVKNKEGLKAHKVADVADFWNGQKSIEVCDPNILALPTRDKEDLLSQYADTRAMITFNQGLDIRLMDESVMEIMGTMRLEDVHFAWDNPHDDLEDKFRIYAEKTKAKLKHGGKGGVFVLTGYNSTMDENIYRVETLRKLGYSPYVMIYDKPNADREVVRYQRYVNNKRIFRSVTWQEYNGRDRKNAEPLDGQLCI